MAAKKLRKVLVIPASGDLMLQEIAANDLKAMQALVGGYIEPVHGPRNVLAYVNEEGLMQALPINKVLSMLMQRPLVGPGFIELDSRENKGKWLVTADDAGVVTDVQIAERG